MRTPRKCLLATDSSEVVSSFTPSSVLRPPRMQQPEVPESVRSHYMLLKNKASKCIGCRSCEQRCPFGVPVAERMEKAAALFGE